MQNMTSFRQKPGVHFSERNVFEAEWFDNVASVLRKFYLYYYPADNTVELFDVKTKKTFLRRSKCEGLEAKDLYIGGVVKIFSRCMKITDFGDSATRSKLASTMQRTCATLKPNVIDKMGEILKYITNHDIHIGNIKMVALTNEEAADFYSHLRGHNELPFILDYMISGPIVALELIGENCIKKWRELIGAETSSVSVESGKTSLRARYGQDSIHNSLHGSDSEEAAEREINFFFSQPKSRRKGPKNTAVYKNCTCCVIKPHAVQARLIGDIINDIQQEGYKISAVQQFYIDPTNAEEFLEVYKGVLPDYNAMVAELQSGPCVAMEITHADESINVLTEFRKLCGPMDPEIARQLRPHTLRAKYGKTKIQNAVHCSDIPEDGLLEVEYFFKILAEE
ncbi:nucleoside diphosphate kinase 7 isoform X1 [Cephus cinctus]|uniref:Nucleoside diphosphate kinase n=1 Tax=Cephus cinctus TaxID=211228 RepID=A0AAJ7C4K4_CEPCN|nr:nucleoside diphosphate kinase 7 isoform X1 [Cephus cinctus]XP_024943938.1 nucleoside diphosphate kinase 7 isoform X1 [Cephus cinctus]XP_024943939.1 nucleoside diphosphate kinase 7 isoform X1 [Cephus cinctus]XP_024943940.1 nucleoside diphosphate kinase 7 isoform X1 [Cephus cinctus]